MPDGSQLTAADLLNALDEAQAKNSFRKFCEVIEIPGAPVEDREADPPKEGEDDGGAYADKVREDDAADAPTPLRDRTPQAAHHLLLIEVCERMERGEIPRAMFFLPPGSAKSTYGSVLFPPWFMGKKKRRNVILNTYATSLARKMGRRARSVARQPAYQRIMGAGVSKETSGVENWLLDNESEFMGAGILAGNTGNRADLIVIDDPIKGRQQADSETIRTSTLEAFQDDLRTRLKPGGRVLLIQTRWHEEDLAGKLLPEGYQGQSGWVECRDGQRWFVVNIPAQAEHADDPLGRRIGEYLWPEWFPPEHWEQFKANARTWSALFQQRPSPAQGTYFQAAWFKRWTVRPMYRRTYLSSDHAPAGADDSDYQVLRVWDVDELGSLYLVDGFRAQCTMDVLAKEARDLIIKYKPQAWFPEDDNNWKAAAPFIMRDLRRTTDNQGRPIKPALVRVAPISPHGADKLVKATAFQALASNGQVFLPAGPVGDEVLQQYIKFPSGKNDDEVDAAATMGRALDMAHPAIVPFEDIKKGPQDRYARARAEAEAAGTQDSDWTTY